MNKITIVCHDAGGAQIISHWIKKVGINCNFFIQGPAIKIFNEVLNVKSDKDLNKMIRQSSCLICGTSWQSDLEKKAIYISKKLQKKTIVFFDHWTHFERRLIYKGSYLNPDQIWVTDKYAKGIARNLFKSTKIRVRQNYYLKYQIENIKKFEKNNSKKERTRILFIGENISEHSEKWYGKKKFLGFDEIDCLEYFLKNIRKITDSKCLITIRPHPSESSDKYKYCIKNKNYNNEYNFVFSENKSLASDISNSDIVVGCESMAMVVALYANKKVFCCKPPFASKCVLPFKEISNISDISDTY